MTEPAMARDARRASERDRSPAAPRAGNAQKLAAGGRRRTSAHLPGPRATAERVTITLAGGTLRALARAMIGLARVHTVGLEDVLRVKAAGRRILLVSWHGYDLCNLAVYPVLYGRESRAVIMAPMTWEGRVMEQLATGMGYEVIPIGVDPSSPVSARGVVEMVARIKDGCDGMIAVDGPSGPPEQAKLGAAVIAKRAAAVVVPTVVAGSREFRIRSRWDKHLLIPPLARMLMHFGPLIDTRPEHDITPSPEEIRERIEVALLEGAARARAMLHPTATTRV